MSGWQSWERAADRGPGPFLWKLGVFIVLVMLVMIPVGCALGFIGEGAQVVHDEFGPKAALKKYEWFIDQSNSIEKMNNDIKTYTQRVQDVDNRYSTYGADRTKWTPAIQVQYNHDRGLAYDDLTAVVTQRNNLVREYNAESSKFNWSPFKTKPDLPPQNYEEYVIPPTLATAGK